MPVVTAPLPSRVLAGYKQWIPDLRMGLENLLAHRLRSLLTMLGMIFGVAAVVSMLSIGAGARQRVMALIEQLGVHNLIVEAKETTEWQAHIKMRKVSPGLTLQDYRIIQDEVNDLTASTARKRFTPSKTIPKAQQEPPTVYGVSSHYIDVMGLHLLQGRFFASNEEIHGSAVCVLGAGAKSNLFGANNPLGQRVKLNQQWLQVIGVATPQNSSQSEVSGVPAQYSNDLIYVPLIAPILRIEDSYS